MSTIHVLFENFSKYRCSEIPYSRFAVNVEGEITPTEKRVKHRTDSSRDLVLHGLSPWLERHSSKSVQDFQDFAILYYFYMLFYIFLIFLCLFSNFEVLYGQFS